MSTPRWISDGLQRPRTFAWAFRGFWASLPLAGPAFAAIFHDCSTPVRAVGTAGLWITWLVVLTASLVPTTVALTVIRLLVPAAPVAAIVATMRGAGPGAAALAISVALVAAALAYTGEVGVLFVQGSAYGDEARFPLRPPGPLMLGPLPIGWLLVASAAVAGVLLLAAKTWIAGVVLTAVGVGLAATFGRRCHRLTRRFMVFVPAGVVLHDHLVLADTVMLRKSDIASVDLAEAGTEAADATGKALGNAVELRMKEFETIVFAASPGKPGGSAIHAKALLVSPSRPGLALAEARRRGHRASAV